MKWMMFLVVSFNYGYKYKFFHYKYLSHLLCMTLWEPLKLISIFPLELCIISKPAEWDREQINSMILQVRDGSHDNC